ncbi:hypothetical protein Syun_007624 [Stephania yunnanensis]|uniref:Uncharacterized protein n=1 Tax=Stephania yunnanensis TaxID=152371 RepID=A0AAP0L0A7_9MAGN
MAPHLQNPPSSSSSVIAPRSRRPLVVAFRIRSLSCSHPVARRHRARLSLFSVVFVRTLRLAPAARRRAFDYATSGLLLGLSTSPRTRWLRSRGARPIARPFSHPPSHLLSLASPPSSPLRKLEARKKRIWLGTFETTERGKEGAYDARSGRSYEWRNAKTNSNWVMHVELGKKNAQPPPLIDAIVAVVAAITYATKFLSETSQSDVANSLTMEWKRRIGLHCEMIEELLNGNCSNPSTSSARKLPSLMVVRLHVDYAWWSLYCCLARLIGAELEFCIILRQTLFCRAELEFCIILRQTLFCRYLPYE